MRFELGACIMNRFQPVSVIPATKMELIPWVSVRKQMWPQYSREQHFEELVSLLESGRFHAWVAKTKDQYIGLIEVYVRPFASECKTQSVPFVEGVWVDPDWRAKKIGMMLFKEVEIWSKENNFKEIGSGAELNNFLFHRAHISWGFKETERVICFKKSI